MAGTRNRHRNGPLRHAASLALLAGLFGALALTTVAFAQDDQVPIPRPSPASAPSVDVGEGGPAGRATGPGQTNIAAPGTGGGEVAAADDIDADGLVDVGTGDELLDAGTSGDGLDIGPGGDLDAGGPLDLGVPEVAPPADIRPGLFTLEARLAVDGPPLRTGVKWRIFGNALGADGKLPLLGETSGGVIHVRLDPGVYHVHAAYGRTGAVRTVDLKEPTGGQMVVLNAGGMRLLAINGEDQSLAAGDVTFDVYAPDEGGSDERFVLVSGEPPGGILGLAAGVYHVVCRYGDANAIVRADIRVEPGKLTEATMYQKAARLTLKLVEAHGGEALADTAWSVVTPAGEGIIESVGAFPTVVLAAGDYTAIAKHDGRIFESNFKVEAGVDRDVEVLLR